MSTTTVKLAERILASSRLIADKMPSGFLPSSALEILMQIYIAEEEATYLNVAALSTYGGTTTSINRRWVTALRAEGFVECRDDLVALTTKGYELVVDILESLFDRQRELD